ncbi:MAG: DUF2153 family protein [Nitrososphaerales archaeon]
MSDSESVRLSNTSSEKSDSSTWLDERATALKKLQSLPSSDRLSLYSGTLVMNKMLYESIQGWGKWLTVPDFMNTFSKEELQEIFKDFHDFTTKFLELDVKWTQRKQVARQPEGKPRSNMQSAWG